MRLTLVCAMLSHQLNRYGSAYAVSLVESHIPLPPSISSCLDSLQATPSALHLSESSVQAVSDRYERDILISEEATSQIFPPSSNKIPSIDIEIGSNKCLASEEMRVPKQNAIIGFLSTLITYVSVNSWFKSAHPEKFIWSTEDREEESWIATSKSWLDRKTCRWLSICGGAHVQLASTKFRHQVESSDRTSTESLHADWNWENAWTESDSEPGDWNNNEQLKKGIPDYILEYAPLVHLYSGEQYWPCDIAEHLHHITPRLNYTPLQSESDHPTLKDLNELNKWEHGRWVFLTSNDDPEARPPWLEGEKNIPEESNDPDDTFEDNDGWIHHPGRTYYHGLKTAVEDTKSWFGAGRKFDSDDTLHESETSAKARKFLEDERERLHSELKRQAASEEQFERRRGGRSDAPAVLVMVDKGHDVVDAFWFFFYSFNLGNVVFNVRFGNHVGDWEHTAIRFHKGKPKAVFFSEHNFGSAYSYEAVEKIGKRPIIYSATGTHAMYATSGTHPYVLPWGILHDQTDRGPLWDPALNSHAYTYDFRNGELRASNITPKAPVEWFHFAGHWGDKFYPLGDRRQYRFAGQYKYVNGPLGPKFKNLGRRKICGGPDAEPCIIKHWLGGENRVKRVLLNGEDDIN